MNDELGQNAPKGVTGKSEQENKAPAKAPQSAPESTEESAMKRPMYGDLSANRLMQAQMASGEPHFLEKHSLGENASGSHDPKAFAAQIPGRELATEELRKKAAENIEKAKAAPVQTGPRVKAADVLHNENALKRLRTLQSDAAEVMEKKNASVISVKLAEEKKYEEKVKAGEEKPRERKPAPAPGGTSAAWGVKAVSLFLSILLILVGVSVVFIFNYFSKVEWLGAPDFATLIPYDELREIDAASGRDGLTAAFAAARAETPQTPNAVTYFKISETVPVTDPETGETRNESRDITIDRFLAIMRSDPPQPLIRSFDPVFMAGTYSGEASEPFILIQVASFDNAYGGMLEWEDVLASELGPLFSDSPLRRRPLVEMVSVASGTPVADISARDQSIFEDVLVQNIDTRAVRNESGEIAMIYAFIDPKTLLITTNEATLRALIDKINAAKLVR